MVKCKNPTRLRHGAPKIDGALAMEGLRSFFLLSENPPNTARGLDGSSAGCCSCGCSVACGAELFRIPMLNVRPLNAVDPALTEASGNGGALCILLANAGTLLDWSSACCFVFLRCIFSSFRCALLAFRIMA